MGRKSYFENRGIALIIVLMVLGTLTLIAIPFVVSMFYHHASVKVESDYGKSNVTAQSAINYAYSNILPTHPYFEATSGVEPFNTYDYDSFKEFQLNWKSTAYEKDYVWGIQIQDEQTKLNMATAPKRIIDNLKKFADLRILNRDDFLTWHSGRPFSWYRLQPVALYTDSKGNVIDWNVISNYGTLAKGTKLKIQNGTNTIITEVIDLKRIEMKDGTQVPVGNVLKDSLANIYKEDVTFIECEYRHPINVNTASKEVFAAIFYGILTKEEAEKLAGAIIREKSVFKDTSEFSAKLYQLEDSNGISPERSSLLNSCLFFPLMWNELIKTKCNIDYSDWEGLVPICVESYNTLSFTGVGVLDKPSGDQAGKSFVRKTIDISPIGEVISFTERQKDFNRLFEIEKANYWTLITYPKFDMTFAGGDESRAILVGDVRLRAPTDSRGREHGYLQSFVDKHEGLEMKGSPYVVPMQNTTIPKVWTRLPSAGDSGKSGTAGPGGGGTVTSGEVLDIGAGGFEIWVMFDSIGGGRTYILDVGQHEWENRISLYYERGELVLSVCDATVDKMAAQVRAPYTFKPDTWYHIGAYWKSPKYGHLALMIDGLKFGKFTYRNDSNNEIFTQTTSAIREDDTTIPVSSTENFPDRGVIEIGGEAIEYNGKSGTGFINIIRGARGTTKQQHINKAKVSIFGYSNLLFKTKITIFNLEIEIDRIPVVSGKLLKRFGPKTNTRVFKPVMGGGGGGGGKDNGGGGDVFDGIRADDTIIPIQPDDTTDDFPDEGYILVGQEVVWYKQKIPDAFIDCERGQLGTEAQDWPNGTPIRLFAIPVTSIDNYFDLSIIQIDYEWFVGKKHNDDRGNFFIGFEAEGALLPIIREFAGTSREEHNADAKVIPVFVTNDAECGAEDMVTIITRDQENGKEQMKIRQSKGNLAAFDDFNQKEYVADNVTRLLKFPSEELISYVKDANIYIGGKAPVGSGSGSGGSYTAVPMTGKIDDVKFYIHQRRGNYILEESIGENDKLIKVTDFNSGYGGGGLILVGDEFIGYRDDLTDTVRGYLRSSGEVHNKGDRVFSIVFLPVSYIENSISAQEDEIKIKNLSGFAEVLYIEDEAKSSSALSYANAELISMQNMPVDRNNVGLYRGAYGTAPSPHMSRTLVFSFPYRYHSRYKKYAFHTTMNYLSVPVRIKEAKWKKVVLSTKIDDKLTDILCFVRFNGKPGWDTRPTNQKNGIFEINLANGEINKDGIVADEIEVIVFFNYESGAFNPNTRSNSWKKTPILDAIHIYYEKPPIEREYDEE